MKEFVDGIDRQDDAHDTDRSVHAQILLFSEIGNRTKMVYSFFYFLSCDKA